MSSKLFFIIGIILQSTLVYANYDILKIRRSDGSEITAYLKYPSEIESFSLLLNISGSKCGTDYNPSEPSATYSTFKFAELKVEKYGIDENFSPSQCGSTYKEKNNIYQRASDYNAVINYIKLNYSQYNDRAFILAGSEGTVVAPLITRLTSDIKAMALWAGARGMDMANEFFLNLKKGNSICSDTQPNSTSYKIKFNEIMSNSNSIHIWCSNEQNLSVNSYQWWAKILYYNPLNDFLNFKGQIYVAHGKKDKMIPIESTMLTYNKFKDQNKSNLTLKAYDNLNHSCNDSDGNNHCDQVFTGIFEWLFNQINLSNRSSHLKGEN